MIPVRLAPHVYTLLRIVAAFLFMLHGLQKLFGVLGGNVVPLMSMLGVAGLIETIAGALILLGLFTRPAAFIASGEMAAAYFLAHQPRGPLPLRNAGEPTVLLCFIFLYVASRGAGPFSIDALRTTSRKSSTA